MPKDLIFERRMRRIAHRRGFEVIKSSRRDPLALGYGKFHVVDARSGEVVAGRPNSHDALTLEQVEAWFLKQGRDA